MKHLLYFLNREPALFTGLVQSAIGMVVVFGLPMSTEQIGAIVLLAGAVGAYFTRRSVRPLTPKRGKIQ